MKYTLMFTKIDGFPDRNSRLEALTKPELWHKIKEKYRNNHSFLNQYPVVQNIHKIYYLDFLLNTFPAEDDDLNRNLKIALDHLNSLPYGIQRTEKIINFLSNPAVRHYFCDTILPGLLKLCFNLDETQMLSNLHNQLLSLLQQEHQSYLDTCNYLRYLGVDNANKYVYKTQVMKDIAEKKLVVTVIPPLPIGPEQKEEWLKNPNVQYNLEVLSKIALNQIETKNSLKPKTGR